MGYWAGFEGKWRVCCLEGVLSEEMETVDEITKLQMRL